MFIQRRELALQRRELFLTRQEAKKQREAAQELAAASDRANVLAEARLEAERSSARQARSANILAARSQMIEIVRLGGQSSRDAAPAKSFLRQAAPDMVAKARTMPGAHELQVFCIPLLDEVRDELDMLRAEADLEDAEGVDRLKSRAAEMREARAAEEETETEARTEAKLAAMSEGMKEEAET